MTRYVFAAALAAALAGPAMADETGFQALEAPQNAANAKPGPRTVPGRAIPVPSAPDLSPAGQALVAAPNLMPAWNANPADADAWRTLIKRLADASLPRLATMRETLGVSMEQTTIGGVNCYVFTPRQIPDGHRNQSIVDPHGGGYVYGPGVSGTAEATLLAAIGGYKVIEIDDRMPPDAPYPAAMDDAMAPASSSACWSASTSDIDRRCRLTSRAAETVQSCPSTANGSGPFSSSASISTGSPLSRPSPAAHDAEHGSYRRRRHI